MLLRVVLLVSFLTRTWLLTLILCLCWSHTLFMQHVISLKHVSWIHHFHQTSHLLFLFCFFFLYFWLVWSSFNFPAMLIELLSNLYTVHYLYSLITTIAVAGLGCESWLYRAMMVIRLVIMVVSSIFTRRFGLSLIAAMGLLPCVTVMSFSCHLDSRFSISLLVSILVRVRQCDKLISALSHETVCLRDLRTTILKLSYIFIHWFWFS